MHGFARSIPCATYYGKRYWVLSSIETISRAEGWLQYNTITSYYYSEWILYCNVLLCWSGPDANVGPSMVWSIESKPFKSFGQWHCAHHLSCALGIASECLISVALGVSWQLRILCWMMLSCLLSGSKPFVKVRRESMDVSTIWRSVVLSDWRSTVASTTVTVSMLFLVCHCEGVTISFRFRFVSAVAIAQ